MQVSGKSTTDIRQIIEISYTTSAELFNPISSEKSMNPYASVNRFFYKFTDDSVTES